MIEQINAVFRSCGGGAPAEPGYRRRLTRRFAIPGIPRAWDCEAPAEPLVGLAHQEVRRPGVVQDRLARCGLAFCLCLVWLAICGRAEAQQEVRVSPPKKPLVFCVTPNSMPRTGKAADGTPRGLDVDVAKSVGRVLERAVEFHWCASAACSWHCLPEGRCDVIAGLPIDSGPARVAAWSVPYAGARFGLIVRRDSHGIRSLEDVRGKRVGIVAGTVELSEKDHVIARFKSRESLVDGFAAAGLDAAFLDGDFAAWYLHEHPHLSLKPVPEFVPRERWNMAFAVRAKDGELLVAINRALALLAGSGELQRIYADYGVAFQPPFTSSGPERPSAGTWPRALARGELVVSMDPANLPYSSARAEYPGIDVEVARALASKLRMKLRIDWLDVQHETAVGELLEHGCDLILGEAVANNAVADDTELAGKILYSRPYYATGYLLVERKNGPKVRSLEELKGARSRRLGAEAGSLADYRLRQRGYLRQLFRNQLSALKALSDGAIDHAYLWANAGWLVHTSPELNVEVSADFLPVDRWDIAVAMRKGDDELKRAVDRALGELIAEGTIARVVARYHVPYFPPFSEQKRDTLPNAGAPDGHSAAGSGHTQNMQKIQRSKHGYHGLARVRSAGELVVGLDQNNLPFSTAHPEPAGLDFEIAGLLARELGVRLRVYWAYSSHDSYPSKLASKELCDVILGVTPDDRFGTRVLYSRPYYHAMYLVVFRAGEAASSFAEPMAVEAGVAVRGLRERTAHSYPSTEAVLEAVASGREKAGYVISTRGPWLAETLCPGKLVFRKISSAGSQAESVDRFPICAAIRKSDPELKDAIERAWEKLDQSGRLAGIFARWHIPYERNGLARLRVGEPLGEPALAAATREGEPPGEPVFAVARQEPRPPGITKPHPAVNAAKKLAGRNFTSLLQPPLQAKGPASTPPDANALAEGQSLFRGLCSGCHGGSGRGGKGPDLTDARWIHGSTDDDIARVIQNGVPRTTMKKLGDSLKSDQIHKVIAYIRSLARSPGESTWKPYVSGDSQRGRKLFFDLQGKLQCAKCHSVGSEGGRIGPALDRIASRRAAEFIMESILEPSKEIAPEYEAVAVATKDGRVLTGIRINESNFSIQLHEENGRFHSFLKRDLDEVKVTKKSLMPENLAELITVKDLHDLFAYLMTLE
jgi:putative heme-binding domain-containing protein